MQRRAVLAISVVIVLGATLGWLSLARDGLAFAAGTVRYVAPGGNCGPVTPCYASVQAAADAATAGDEIRVAASTYSGVQTREGLRQVIYVDKTVTIRGGYTLSSWTSSDPAAYPTTLDAGGQGRVLYVTGDISATIEGLRVTGGDATGLGGYYGTDAGGGIYVITATVTLRENEIYANHSGASGHGAGLFFHNGEGLLQANQIYSNTAGQFGGGLYLAMGRITLSDNVISGNEAGAYGGGLYLEWSDALLQHNTLRGNTAQQGGGGYLYYGSWTTCDHNIVEGNSSRHGGGLHLFRSDTLLTHNLIKDNVAETEGGGLWLYQSDATLDGDILSGNEADRGGGLWIMDASPTLTNVALLDNRGASGASSGSGLYATSAEPHLVHTTWAGNAGGDGSGVRLTDDGYGQYTTAVFTNTIIADHITGIVAQHGSSAKLNSTLWYNNLMNASGDVTGSHDHTGDPRFAADGYHLLAGSAAIDRGVSTSVEADIDGDSRPQDAGYDLGADEFTATPHGALKTYLPLVNRRR